MRIKQFIIYSVVRHMRPIKSKQSYIIRLVDDQGKSGLGEVAPLEGRSIESMEEALDCILAVKAQMTEGTFNPFPLPPSVMFGLSSALADLNTELEPFSFPMTTLSFPDEPYVEGIRDVKVKASSSLDETEKRVRSYLSCDCKVRVDINHKWSVDDAIAFVNRFDRGDLFYVEDPVNLSVLPYFIEHTDVAIALDEFVHLNPIESLVVHDRVTHIIIKPSLVGGIEQCRKICEVAKEGGKEVVFSSAFESGIGLAHIVRIAQLLGYKGPHGVDTLKYCTDGLFPGEDTFCKGMCSPFNIEALENNGILSNL